MKKNEFLYFVLCLLICAGLVFSYSFIATEFNHECSAEECHICLEIEACLKAISDIACGVFAACTSIKVVLHILELCKAENKGRSVSTLVSLKIKLTI